MCWVGVRDMVSSPDRPVLTEILYSGASTVASAVNSTIEKTKSALKEMDLEADLEVARGQARAAEQVELRESAVPPWQTLSEQFAILEEELKMIGDNMKQLEVLLVTQ